ncbi:MAG: hypothetical protein H5T86_04590 [Armatimonadetes bacterium]|nr:hypothetical protein [Armatimonadota bacterium]
MPRLLRTPVIKFGGKTLQGLRRFGGQLERLVAICRGVQCEEDIGEVYAKLAAERNRARARRLQEVARDFIIPLCTEHSVPVVVVSAFDVATDKLDWLAAEIACAVDPTCCPSSKAKEDRVAAKRAPREYARLLMSGELRANSALAIALEMMGYKARSLTGREAGIVTRTGNARLGPAVDAMIQTVHEGYLLELVTQGVIPVVAGFQGYFNDPETGRDEVSILARGGSNLTAVALADALGEDECTMFTDVDGVYDKDPTKHPDAKKFEPEVPARTLFELEQFPNCIQQEALAYAVYHNIDIWIRSGFDPNVPGTKIVCKGEWDYIPQKYRDIVLGVADSLAKEDEDGT